MKRVLKYGTGHEIPDNAKYLCTKVETLEISSRNEKTGADETFTKNILVWHYYEVSSEEAKP